MSDLETARQDFILGLSRISQFWGFSKAMGAIFAALYLSPKPLSLDDLVDQVEVSKGTVSTNVRALERLGMVHKQIMLGERKDYYTAETDLWAVVKGILREREKAEFDHAIRSVSETLELVRKGDHQPEDARLAAFYEARMSAIARFFRSLDNIVATILALDELRIGALEKLIRPAKDTEK